MAFVRNIRVAVGVLPQLHLCAECFDVCLDERLRKRNHFDWKRKLAQPLNRLRRIADNDEPPRYRYNNLVSKKCTASALDQLHLRINYRCSAYIDFYDS